MEVLVEVVERHAAEAAFCWTQRDAAAQSPAYDLGELCELDDRLECHLDGLRAAGAVGWERCAAELGDAYPGVLFPAAVLAVEREDWPGFARVLDAGAEDPARARAVASALGFLPFERLGVVWTGMLAAGAPAPLLFLGIAGHAIHRRDPGRALLDLAVSDDSRVRARALRAIGELGRTDLLRVLHTGLSDPEEPCRFRAAWSAALLREPRALPVLREIASANGPLAEQAAALLARASAPADGRRFVEQLAAHAERPAIVAAGALGDPALIPWLLGQAAKEETARLAAWSITLITNADVTEDLGAPVPAGFQSGPSDDPEDEDVSADPDDDLPWPDVARLTTWLGERRFQEGARHLLGKPMEVPWLRHVLRHGNQAVRAAAAVELTLRLRGEPLFEVRSPAHLQLAALPA